MFKINGSCVHLVSGTARSLIVFFFCSVFPCSLYARITPAEGSKLNYRIIGFAFPAKLATKQYTVEIAYGNFSKEKDFSGHVCQAASSRQNKLILEVPYFGGEYTWRVVYRSDSTVRSKSAFYHFTTGVLREDSTSIHRLRIKTNTQNYPDAYVLVDGINTIYDMNGRPVWFLPAAASINLASDVKISPTGSITFLAGGGAYEIDYNGKVLWAAKNRSDPKNPDLPHATCHHELIKLNNGHYMVLMASGPGVAGRPPAAEGRKKFFPSLFASTLVEFDKEGNRVWAWESSAYARQSDLGVLQERNPDMPVDLHENAFCFDEKNGVVYLSMAGISRIVKIQYPSGKVLAEYGNIIRSSQLPSSGSAGQTPFDTKQLFSNKLFRFQHSLKQSEDHFLYTFSSSLAAGGSTSEANGQYPLILKMRESGDTLEKVWDLDCRQIIDGRKDKSGGGGNVVVLQDNSLFVSMCSPYDDLFIVDTGKNILWSAIAETWMPGEDIWKPYSKYRASIITRRQLEQMIWIERRNSLP